MELVGLKLENSLLSKSDMTFFGNRRDLKQNYLKALKGKSGIEAFPAWSLSYAEGRGSGCCVIANQVP